MIPEYLQWLTFDFLFPVYKSLFHGTTGRSRAGPPHCRDFTITLRHTTHGRTPLDQLSARRRDLYLTTHNAGFEPEIAGNE